jgi:tetratricopeptide (TPR) repeat protein
VYTSDHVFCKVKTPEGDTDVETTNPYGYNPGEKKEFHDKFGRTGYTYVPPGNYRKRTEDDDRRLLSFILQNRISAFEKAKQYGKAVPLAVDRYTVLGTEKAEEAMVKEFVNYLSLLNEQRQIEAAFTFLDMVEKKYGPDPKYEKITYVLVNNTVTQYINNEQFDRAVSFLGKKREQGDISQEKYSEFKSRVEGRRIHVKVHSLPIDEAIHFVEKSYREDRVGKDRYGEYVSYLYVKKAEQTANQEGWLAAVDIVDAGLEKLPGNRKLQEAKSVFEHNYAARVHNRFARLFNEGSYDEAKRVIESALEKLPESSLLQRDLSTVEQALSQS